MFTDTFMRVQARGISLRTVATHYAEWSLGLGSTKVREFRLSEGVHSTWSVEQVLGSNALIGEHGCRIEMRLSSETMLLRYTHRDSDDGAIFWHTAASAREFDGGIDIEHAVGRDAPKDYRLWPVASASRVVLDLIDQDGVEIGPQELVMPPVYLKAGEVRGFVEHVLLRPGRTLPLVIVACDRGGKPPLVDTFKFARKLRGICGVAVLPTEEATFEFSNAVDRLGIEFRCFNGAIHTFGPTATLEEDHRLWLGDSLAKIDSRVRTEHAAGLLAQRIALREAPPGCFTQIEEHDREERRLIARRLSQKRSDPPPALDGPSAGESAALAEQQKQITELQGALRRALDDEKSASEEWEKAAREAQQFALERDAAEGRAEQERVRASDLQDRLQVMKVGQSRERPTAELTAIRAVLGDSLSPYDCLQLLTMAYPDRVVVLDSALTSAEKAQEFRHSRKLMALLVSLASSYWECLATGKGDTEAAKVFTPNTFAATESETTRSNKQAIEERTFTYNRRKLTMWPHLKINTAETIAETIRVHFAWVADEKRIVVGWCGEHRYRVA